MSNFLSIEPLEFGLQIATKANLVWIAQPFFSNDLTLRVEFYDANLMLVDFKDIRLTVAAYAAKGADKWSRCLNVLQEQDIYVSSLQEDIMQEPLQDILL